MRLGVNGLDHNHVFEIVDRLVKAGAEAAAHVADGGFLEAYEGWQTESRPVSFEEMLADDSIDLVVTAAIPNRRADIALGRSPPASTSSPTNPASPR